MEGNLVCRRGTVCMTFLCTALSHWRQTCVIHIAHELVRMQPRLHVHARNASLVRTCMHLFVPSLKCNNVCLVQCMCFTCSTTYCGTKAQNQQVQENTTKCTMMAPTSVEAVALPCTSECLSPTLNFCSCLCNPDFILCCQHTLYLTGLT